VHRIIDTNVLVCASGRAEHVPEACRRACEDFVLACNERGVTLLDDRDHALDEYAKHFSYSGQPTLGDRFFLHLHQSIANPAVCMRVPITPNAERGFDEFPDDPALSSFDPSDRKWVAIATAAERIAPIYNATDSDWMEFSAAIKRHRVEVIELCPTCSSPEKRAAPTSGNRQKGPTTK
jgi:hypothetical protein